MCLYRIFYLIEPYYYSDTIYMNLSDVPERRSAKYTETALLAITKEQKEYLLELKRRKKDTSSLLRMLLDKFITDNPLDKSA